MKKNQELIKNSLPYIVLMIVVITTLLFYNTAHYEIHILTTGELISDIKDSKVTEMILHNLIFGIFYAIIKID